MQGQPRRNPQFSIAMWNCREIMEHDLPRTKNNIEKIRSNAIYARLNAGEDVPLYTLKYGQNNDNILRLIGRYDEMKADAFLIACNHFAAPPQEIAADLEDDDYESDKIV